MMIQLNNQTFADFHYFTGTCSVAYCQLQIKHISYVMYRNINVPVRYKPVFHCLILQQSNLRILSLFGLYNFTLRHYLYSFADFSLLYMYNIMFSCILTT